VCLVSEEVCVGEFISRELGLGRLRILRPRGAAHERVRRDLARRGGVHARGGAYCTRSYSPGPFLALVLLSIDSSFRPFCMKCRVKSSLTLAIKRRVN